MVVAALSGSFKSAAGEQESTDAIGKLLKHRSRCGLRTSPTSRPA
jgi:hypothetical protein